MRLRHLIPYELGAFNAFRTQVGPLSFRVSLLWYQNLASPLSLSFSSFSLSSQFECVRLYTSTINVASFSPFGLGDPSLYMLTAHCVTVCALILERERSSSRPDLFQELSASVCLSTSLFLFPGR